MCVVGRTKQGGGEYLYANEEVRKQLGNYLNLGTKFNTCNDLRINGQDQAISVKPPLVAVLSSLGSKCGHLRILSKILG